MNSSFNKSKLARKRPKSRKGLNLFSEQLPASSPLARTPSQPSALSPPTAQVSCSNSFEDSSSDRNFLSSQAPIPEKEVYWDYDNPQIQRYRKRMGIGQPEDETSSPIRPVFPVTAVSTPKLKMQCEPRVKIDLDTSDAKAAYNDLLALRSKLNIQRVTKCEKGSSSAGPAELSEAAATNSVNFSDDDDDSLLLRYAEEVESTQRVALPTAEPLIQPEFQHSKENSKEPPEAGFESDESLEYIMSQMDEREIVPGYQGGNTEVLPLQSVQNKNPLSNLDANIAPYSPRAIKRNKSSDDGCPKKKSATPIRRIHSSPVIQPEKEAPSRKCDKAEIEKKRMEAKRRRELSQMKR